jgi:hypothetical protein
MLPYNIGKVVHGYLGFGRQPCDQIYNVTLTAAEATLIVPADLPLGALGMIGSATPGQNLPGDTPGHNKVLAIFSYGGTAPADVWVSVNTPATVPAGATLAKAGAILRPNALTLKAGDVIHMIGSVAGATCSVELFNITE